ncbi:hypothetical protein ACFXJ5_19570 [Streptomyces sp. NPDC059373]
MELGPQIRRMLGLGLRSRRHLLASIRGRLVHAHGGIDEATTAYEHFDARNDGWINVLFHPNGVR